MQRELLQRQIITATQFGAWHKPPEGRLIDLLVENHADIAPGKWISWLVVEHGCIRYTDPQPEASWLKGLGLDRSLQLKLTAHDCYPLEAWGKSLMVGVVRPDCVHLLSELQSSAGFDSVVKVALSPTDVHALRTLLRGPRKCAIK